MQTTAAELHLVEIQTQVRLAIIRIVINTDASKYTLLGITLYVAQSVFLKLSLATFFLRVVMERWQRWVIISSVSVYTAYSFAFLFTCIFQCGNPSHVLMSRLANKCMSWDILGPLFYIHGCLNAVVDWILVFLPIFVMRKTKLARTAKISVFCILALGALGSIASLARLAFMDGYDWKAPDYYPQALKTTLCTVLEPGLGIVAGSLATLRPLLRIIRNRLSQSWPMSKFCTTTDSDTETGPSPPVSSGPSVKKPQGEFAVYGFADDFEAEPLGGVTTIISKTDSDAEKGQIITTLPSTIHGNVRDSKLETVVPLEWENALPTFPQAISSSLSPTRSTNLHAKP